MPESRQDEAPVKLKIIAALAALAGLTSCSGGDDVQGVVRQLSQGDGKVCQNPAVLTTIDNIVNPRETVFAGFRYRDPHVRDLWEIFLSSYRGQWTLMTLQALDRQTRTATCAGVYSGRYEGTDGFETTQQVTFTVSATVDGQDFVVEIDPTLVRQVIHANVAAYVREIPLDGEEGAPVATLPQASAEGDQSWANNVEDTSGPSVRVPPTKPAAPSPDADEIPRRDDPVANPPQDPGPPSTLHY